jgi:hypothetical protein
MVSYEAAQLAGHQTGESVAIERGASSHTVRMAAMPASSVVIPRDATGDAATPVHGRSEPALARMGWSAEAAAGSVDPANEPADVAGREPGPRIDLEEAGAAVGAAEQAAIRVDGARATAHTAHR